MLITAATQKQQGRTTQKQQGKMTQKQQGKMTQKQQAKRLRSSKNYLESGTNAAKIVIQNITNPAKQHKSSKKY